MYYLQNCYRMKRLLQYQILTFLFGFFVKNTLSMQYDLILERIECFASGNDICKNMSCRATPIKRYVSYINAACDLSEDIGLTHNVKIRNTLYYKFTEYRKFLIDVEDNLCDYLEKPILASAPLLHVFMPQIVNSSNFKSCPLKGHVRFKDLHLNSERNPIGIPAGQYRLDSLLTANNRRVFLARTYGSARPRGAIKLDMG